ncbi:MAG: CvpA family protein [Clostridia bacterium]|nr:CvpA family protein [Clostridia bacterium]
MAIIIDIVIVAIIALCLFLGYRRGLTGSLLKILSFVLAIVIAFILFKPVSNLVINHTKWDDSLKTSIEQFITEKTSTPEEKSSLPQVIVDYIDETMAQSVNEAKEVAIENTAQSVTNLIVNAGVWIAVFIIARILLIFIKFITALIAKLPVIKQFDKLGGILYGILEAFVILYVLLAIISFIAPMINNAEFIDALNKSFIGSMLYNNNILLKILF